jgi:hypothetical protein
MKQPLKTICGMIKAIFRAIPNLFRRRNRGSIMGPEDLVALAGHRLTRMEEIFNHKHRGTITVRWMPPTQDGTNSAVEWKVMPSMQIEEGHPADVTEEMIDHEWMEIFIGPACKPDHQPRSFNGVDIQEHIPSWQYHYE